MTTWSLTFTGTGNTYSGPDPATVLRKLSKAQWDEEGRRNVKRSLAWRAWVTTRTPVDEDMDDGDLLRAIAGAGIAHLEVTDG